MARTPKPALARLETAMKKADLARAAAADAQHTLARAEKARDAAFQVAVVKLAKAAALDRLSPSALADVIESLGQSAPDAVDRTSMWRLAPAERMVARAMPPSGTGASANIAGADISVRVRFTANGSAAKRQLLRDAGLTWNGKAAVHHGRVDEATLGRLVEAFGANKVTIAVADEGSGASPDAGGPSDAGDPLDAVAGTSPLHAATEAGREEGAPPPDRAEVDRGGRRKVPPRPVAADTPRYACADLTGIIAATPTPASADALCSLVHAVVTAEGPIHRDLVRDRVRAALSLPRLTALMVTAIGEIATGLPADPRLEGDEGFLLLPGAPIHVRDRHGAGDRIRHYRYLPICELRVALSEAPARDGATSEKELVAAVARRIGHDLMSHGLETRIREALAVGSPG